MRLPNRLFGRKAIPTSWTGASPWAGPASGTAWDWTFTRCPGFPLGSRTLIEPNMVLCIEPFFYHRGGYPLWEVSNKYGLEDVVLVTENRP